VTDAKRPREWWIDPRPDHKVQFAFETLADFEDVAAYRINDAIHVREVIPGAIQITREEFSMKWSWVMGDIHQGALRDLEKHIFGEAGE
jgi:hypothetical protein